MNASVVNEKCILSLFALIMHNIVKTYIDEPQTLKGNYEGNVIIRCSDVTVASDTEITGNLVICENCNNINITDGAKIQGIIDNRTPKEPQQEKPTEDTMEDNKTNIDTIVRDDNPLSNTYRALKYDKKLTVGYLGGSITFGSSAINDMTDDNGNVLPGDISLSYANRTTKWFTEQFTGCGSYMYGMSKDKMSLTNITENSLIIKDSDTKVRFKFTGTTFSGIFHINKFGINMDYTIDGVQKNFTIDKDSHLAFQMSDHTQLFVIEQDLPHGEHEVELSFNPTSVGDVNIRLAAIAYAGVQVK